MARAGCRLPTPEGGLGIRGWSVRRERAERCILAEMPEGEGHPPLRTAAVALVPAGVRGSRDVEPNVESLAHGLRSHVEPPVDGRHGV